MNLTHLNSSGEAQMVDITDKAISFREAVARGTILLQPETLRLIRENQMKKGDVLAVARIAAIQAAKQTALLIPLCHQIPLSKVGVEFEFHDQGLDAIATAKTQSATGVEMEALTAVNLALLTIYDMCKAVDKLMQFNNIHLVQKTKKTLS